LNRFLNDIFSDRGDPSELGNVGSGRKLDAEFRMTGLRIKLIEAFANIAGSDPDDGIVAGIVCGLSSEELGAERPLLQFIEVPVQRAFHNELKELLAAFAAVERWALDYLFDLRSNGGRVGNNLDNLRYRTHVI